MEIDFHARLTELAKLRQVTEGQVAMFEAQRAKFYALLVQPYEDKIKALQRALADAEQQLRDDTQTYVMETGDLKPHIAITFQRKTRFVYDKAEVLTAAQEHNATDLLRVKTELDVRAFEKAFKDGKAPWAQVEEVNSPTVAISSKLGDLLITEKSA